MTEGRVVKADSWYPVINQYTTPPVRRLCKVTFTYAAEGGRFEQCDYFRTRILKAGQRVKVLFLLARPAVGRLLKPGESR